MEAAGPVVERRDTIDMVPDGAFNSVVSDATQQTLSSKYPQLDTIMSANGDIPVRQLGELLGIGKDTAAKVKKEWLDTHKAVAPVSTPFKMPTFKGHTLTGKEAQEIAGPFTASMESNFQALDEYLWNRQLAAGIDTNEQPIWSDLDTEEIEKLTRIMMRWGQRNGAAATVVRATVESSDYIAVGSIFAPRIRNTVEIMRKTRKAPARRGARLEN